MKRRYVIDAGALALYFAGDPRVKQYFDEVLRGRAEGYMCEVNLAEFYYKTGERLGEDVADIRYLSVRSSPIRLVAAGGELTRQAAKVKLRHRGKVSLADAYLIALTLAIGGIAVTTDSNVKDILKDRCKYVKP